MTILYVKLALNVLKTSSKERGLEKNLIIKIALSN